MLLFILTQALVFSIQIAGILFGNPDATSLISILHASMGWFGFKIDPHGPAIISRKNGPWLAIPRMENPDRGTDANGSWFRERILAAASPGEGGAVKSFEEALQEWRMELVYYPSEQSQCSFGHWIDWGFNFIHSQVPERIELGQGEVVTFGVLSESAKDERLKKYQRANLAANQQWPYIEDYLALIRDYASLLLGSDQWDAEDQARLRAFGAIAQIPQNLRRMDVFDQQVIFEGRHLDLSYESLEAFIERLGELADQNSIAIDRRRMMRTELQRLRTDIARAVGMALIGNFSLWDRLAKRYSQLAENLSAFSIKVATLLRFNGMVSRDDAPGKPRAELKRWGFFGSGPALGLRAASRIASTTEATGIPQPERIVNVDSSLNMLIEGEEAAARETEKLGYVLPVESILTDLAREHIPLENESLDVVETGILGTIGNDLVDGLPSAAHFLAEVNRILSNKGYLLLTVKNRPIPTAFQEALKDFGFRVVTPSHPSLDYDEATLDRITQGDTAKAERLRQQLARSSYLIAVKETAISRERLVERHREHDFAKVLAYDDSPTALNQREGVSRDASPAREVNLEELDYRGVNARVFAQAFISRDDILYDPKFTDFEDRLTCLVWLRDHLDTRDQQRLDEILESWDRRQLYLTEEQLKFVLERPLRHRSRRDGLLFNQIQNAHTAAGIALGSDRDAELAQRGSSFTESATRQNRIVS